MYLGTLPTHELRQIRTSDGERGVRIAPVPLGQRRRACRSAVKDPASPLSQYSLHFVDVKELPEDVVLIEGHSGLRLDHL